jgi:hypothetical protein
MKPGYWLGIMPLIGAIIGYAFYQLTGWLGTGIGTTVGFVIGIAIYARLKDRS